MKIGTVCISRCYFEQKNLMELVYNNMTVLYVEEGLSPDFVYIIGVSKCFKEHQIDKPIRRYHAIVKDVNNTPVFVKFVLS